jgi:primosomal protein N'
MPTGSGKTAVLIGAAFLLQSRRVLVITPSRMVREQIAEEFRLLRVLKMVGAVSADLPTPSVYAVENRIEAEEEWQALTFHDVIVQHTK